MMPDASAFVVYSLDGRPRCWNCGCGAPVIEGKFCSPRCALIGRRMVWCDPTPDQIHERAAQIRRGWPPGEELKRRSGVTLDARAALGWQPPHLAADAIEAATRDRSNRKLE